MTTQAQELTDEQIRFRFFKTLNEGQRLAVFKAFGVYPDNCNESLNHGIEGRLLNAILKRKPAAQAAPTVLDSWMQYFSSARLKTDGFDGYILKVHGTEYSTYPNEFEYLLKCMQDAAQPVQDKQQYLEISIVKLNNGDRWDATIAGRYPIHVSHAGPYEALRMALETAGEQAAQAVPEGWKHTITRAAECLEILNKRPRPMCRDCADENGTCPNGGLDCDMRKLIAEVRTIAAAPSVPSVSEDAKDADLLEVVRTLCSVAAHLRDMDDKKRENYPSPLSGFSPLLIAARQACLNRGFTADGLAIDAAIAAQEAEVGCGSLNSNG